MRTVVVWSLVALTPVVVFFAARFGDRIGRRLRRWAENPEGVDSASADDSDAKRRSSPARVAAVAALTLASVVILRFVLEHPRVPEIPTWMLLVAGITIWGSIMAVSLTRARRRSRRRPDPDDSGAEVSW